MDIFENILSMDEFKDKPPVLLDIGASACIHAKWKDIAKWSICIAFDPDMREMDYIGKENKHFKKLYVFPDIVHESVSGEIDFYLTASPQCSSILRPDKDALQPWYFAELFELEETKKFKSITLPDVLSKLGINYIDWFKADSQGTDLRLFKSLEERIIKNITVAEFEPGLINSYIGEDKLWLLLEFMDTLNSFWISDVKIKGSQFFSAELSKKYLSPFTSKLISSAVKSSPGWAEISYLNKMEAVTERRQLLFAWITAMIERQYGFALYVADKGTKLQNNRIFSELITITIKEFKKSSLNSGLLKKAFAKLLRMFKLRA